MNLLARPPLTRRDFLARVGMGMGALALGGLMTRPAHAAAVNPLAPRAPHFPGKAKAVMGNIAESGYDLVFLDIDPLELEELLPTAVGLIRPGGALVIAHALWRDRVPNPALRDDETAALRATIRAFSEVDGFKSTVSMVGDGLLLVAKGE